MRIFITSCLVLILTSKIFFLFLGSSALLIDDIFIFFCFYYFLKELFNLNYKKTLWLSMLTLWLACTFFVAIFSDAPGYFLTLLVYLKPVVLIAGILVFMRKKYIDLKVIEYVVLLSAFYGIIQFFMYSLTRLVLPGGGEKILYICGKWFLRAGGFCGHPNTFGMMLSPFVSIFFIEKKYIKFLIIATALLLSISRWPIFISALLILFIIPTRKNIFIFLLFVLVIFFFGQPVYHEYKRVYRDYNKENTIKLYGMTIAKEIFLDSPILGVGIGNFGSKYSTNSNIYNKHNFSKKMLMRLKLATSGIESGIAIIFVENGLFLALLYLGIIFQSFNVAQLFIMNRLINIFYFLFIVTLIFYNQYIPEFIITFLSAMYMLSVIKKNCFEEKTDQVSKKFEFVAST